MTDTLKYALAIGITAAAMFAYMYEAPPRQAVHELAQNTPAPTAEAALAKSTEQASDPHQALPQRELSQAELADIDPASIDWEAMKSRLGFYVDPMLLRMQIAASSLTAEEIAAFNKLHVLPFNAKVDEICEEVLVEGQEWLPPEDRVAEHCESVMQFSPHAYTDLPLDQLVALAVTDAEAAVIASRKANNLDEKISLALRAVALSGKSGPALELAKRSFGSSYLSTPNGQTLQVENIFNSIVLEKIAQRLGDPRANPTASFYLIEESGLTEAQKKEFFEDVNNAEKAALETMAAIQSEISGSSQIWELINA